MFTLHSTLNEPIEREISLSNKPTLSQSDLIRMFFISYDACEGCFCFFLMRNKLAFPSHFNAVVLKRMWLRILIMTNKYSWTNWGQRKSPDTREIRIIKVRIIEVWLYIDLFLDECFFILDGQFKISHDSFSFSYSDFYFSRSDFPISHIDHWNSIGNFELKPLLSCLACPILAYKYLPLVHEIHSFFI